MTKGKQQLITIIIVSLVLLGIILVGNVCALELNPSKGQPVFLGDPANPSTYTSTWNNPLPTRVKEGSVTVIPRSWIVYGTTTININPGETKTFTIGTQATAYYLSSVNVIGLGGDAKITLSLPSPHFSRVARMGVFSPNITFSFGEGIKIDSGKAIAIEIKSTDLEIGQVVDISWQASF